MMKQKIFQETIEFIRALYPKEKQIPLHAPCFSGSEKAYLNECIDSTFVSYVGKFVSQFEEMVKSFTKAKHAIAISNGTLALHTALILAHVKPGDEVITQALTFVATTNAISYTGASCIFIDSDKETMGLSPEKLEDFLRHETIIKDDGVCYNKKTHARIAACVPMHVFGHPVKIEKVVQICQQYHILVIEDSAESLGSFYNHQHTGTFGLMGILSFNGNKIITTGGGGMLITNDDSLAKRAKHITTTAKISHPWEFMHDEVGYNYRLPNINSALGCAQMEKLPEYLKIKREIAHQYEVFFTRRGIDFVKEPQHAQSNYWLNAIILKDREERDAFLHQTHENGIQTRPCWKLMPHLPMYQHCQRGDLSTAEWLESRIVNLPSSIRF